MKWKMKKNYMGFRIPKLWQILKHFASSTNLYNFWWVPTQISFQHNTTRNLIDIIDITMIPCIGTCCFYHHTLYLLACSLLFQAMEMQNTYRLKDFDPSRNKNGAKNTTKELTVLTRPLSKQDFKLSCLKMSF